MTTRKTTTRSRKTAAKPKAKPTDIIEINEAKTERARQCDHDVVVYEVYVEKTDKHGNTKTYWQPEGRDVPVLLITHPQTFKVEHELALRLEPHIERKIDRVIRGALKRHDREGELYFELGETEADADEVIDYAITLLKGYGVDASRAIRFTPYMSRAAW